MVTGDFLESLSSEAASRIDSSCNDMVFNPGCISTDIAVAQLLSPSGLAHSVFMDETAMTISTLSMSRSYAFSDKLYNYATKLQTNHITFTSLCKNLKVTRG